MHAHTGKWSVYTNGGEGGRCRVGNHDVGRGVTFERGGEIQGNLYTFLISFSLEAKEGEISTKALFGIPGERANRK